MRKVVISLILFFVLSSLMAVEYFVDPNGEYIYTILDGFEAEYDETDGSLSIFSEELNAVINIMKLSEPTEGLELKMITDEVGKNLEGSGFQVLSVNDRNFLDYPAMTFEAVKKEDGVSVRVEFTFFEVPKRGFYLIVVAAPDEIYEEIVLLLKNAKQMLVFIE